VEDKVKYCGLEHAEHNGGGTNRHATLQRSKNPIQVNLFLGEHEGRQKGRQGGHHDQQEGRATSKKGDQTRDKRCHTKVDTFIASIESPSQESFCGKSCRS
jgi:hypothetical protein